MITALDSGRALREDERRLAAAWLRRLAMTPSARQALQLQGRGRPRSDNSPDIALDYGARKELLGKASAARAAAAEAWGVSEATVKDAWTEWRAGAEWRLNSLAASHVGHLRLACKEADGSYVEYHWTRPELLEALIADLQDRKAARKAGREK